MTQTDEVQEPQKTEAVSEILGDLGNLIANELSGKREIIERSAQSPQKETARRIIEFLFDQAHNDFESYKALARELLSESEFPNRTNRWPAFFGVDQSTTSAGGDN